ncbi:hypothetical protein ARTHROSP310_39190 [Arthrobacter sp. AD-310]
MLPDAQHGLLDHILRELGVAGGSDDEPAEGRTMLAVDRLHHLLVEWHGIPSAAAAHPLFAYHLKTLPPAKKFTVRKKFTPHKKFTAGASAVNHIPPGCVVVVTVR